MNWKSNPWAGNKLDHLSTWLHVRNVNVMALPAYNADGDSQTDHLAGPNQNDEGLDSVHDFTKSSLAAKTAKTDDYLPNKRSENPDVMGLNSLRNKVL